MSVTIRRASRCAAIVASALFAGHAFGAAVAATAVNGAAIATAAGAAGHAKAARATAPAAVASNAAFARWSDSFAADWVRLSPERATATQYFAGAEQNALDRELTPITEAQRTRQRALARAGVKRLDAFLAGALDEGQRVSAMTMRWQLANLLANAPFEDHSFMFSQFSGTHIALVSFLTVTHPMRNAADVDNYLARLAQVGARMDEATARARAAAARGLLPPNFILAKARGQVDAFLQPAAAENVLVTSLAARSAGLSDLTPAARAAAVATATGLVEARVRPAYARAQAFLAEIAPRTTAAAGISRLPDGAAAYAQALATYTSTRLTAAEIHAIGLREVARFEAEMDRRLRALGYVDGGIEERMRVLDRSFAPPADPDPRPALLARYTAMVRDAERRSGALFNVKPRAPVEVRREPALTEGSAAAHYTTPAPDGSRPGVFWVPLRGPDFDIIRMRSLSYHEAVPGHHFQLAIQQETAGLPKFRTQRIFGGGSAHSEGWALYTERLAVEQGWYEGDVPGLLGALGSELFRARRLVVDTGLHSQGWTRQQAIDYGIGEAEVERYVAWPGQACAYMIGMLHIVELREQARAQLGPKFSLPAFHDMVLRTGSVPLDVLDQVVKRWIAEQV